MSPRDLFELQDTPPAMELEWGRSEMSDTAYARVRERLAMGCLCGGTLAKPKRLRDGAGVEKVVLQCQTCGSPIGGALPYSEHPNRARYAAWDYGLQERGAGVLKRLREAGQAFIARQAKEKLANVREARAETLGLAADAEPGPPPGYRERLSSSPEWKALRERVMLRARGVCEACEAERASIVHHLHYRAGELPPAFDLVAVCDGCHGRLHRAGDPWHYKRRLRPT